MAGQRREAQAQRGVRLAAAGRVGDARDKTSCSTELSELSKMNCLSVSLPAVPDFVAVVRARQQRRWAAQRSLHSVVHHRPFVVHCGRTGLRLPSRWPALEPPRLPPPPYVWLVAAERVAQEAEARAAYVAAITGCCSELRVRAASLGRESDAHVPLVHRLAAEVSRGQRVTTGALEAAVERALRLEMKGRLAPLAGAMSRSYAVYDAARERMRRSSGGLDALISLVDQHDATLCQPSDELSLLHEEEFLRLGRVKEPFPVQWRAIHIHADDFLEQLQ